MVQIIQNVVGLILMDVLRVGFDQYFYNFSLLNVSEVESDLILFVAEVNKKIEKGGFVFDVLEVVKNATDYQFFKFRVVFAI